MKGRILLNSGNGNGHKIACPKCGRKIDFKRRQKCSRCGIGIIGYQKHGLPYKITVH